jgi:hypothetical protein
MSTSAIGTVKDAIRAALILRAGLSGVNVYSAAVSSDDAGLECIAIGNAKLDEEAFAMSGYRQEDWRVESEIRVVFKPWQGTTELTIKAARDRTLAIFAEIEAHINDTYTGSLPHAKIIEGDLIEDMIPDGRLCSILFTLLITAVKNP